MWRSILLWELRRNRDQYKMDLLEANREHQHARAAQIETLIFETEKRISEHESKRAKRT